MNANRLRKAVLALALLASLGALGFVALFFWHPVGSGPAGPPVSREAFGQPWTTRPVVLLGLGDSVTKGFGATSGHSYFEQLVANPPNEFDNMKGLCLKTVLPNLTVENYAGNGRTSIECEEDQVTAIMPYDKNTYGVVVVTVGGNDIIHMYGRIPPREGAMYGTTLEEAQPWIDNYEKRLDKIVAAIEAAFPGGCHIFMANIYDPSDGIGHPEIVWLPKWHDMLRMLDAYNACIARCAERHKDTVTLVDMHGLFLGHGITCWWFWSEHYDRKDPHYWYYTNIEDPNDRGYDALRRLFLRSMAGTLPGLLN
jgi:lysophospholipase L1-like esterase